MSSKKMKIPMPTANARIGIIASDLDRDHAPDYEVADEDHEGADRDQDPADEVLEHRAEICRRHEVHERGEHEGQELDEGARCARLGLLGCLLALDAPPLP